MTMHTDVSEFSRKLSSLLIGSLGNDYKNNFDFERFQGSEREIVKSEKNLAYVFTHLQLFSEAHELLENDDSKNLYVLLTAFKILGHRKIRLPLSTNTYWEIRDKLNAYVTASRDHIDAGIFNWKLSLSDLNFLGLPMQQYAMGGTILIEYILKQYEYNRDDFRIGVNKGDVVIDAGACWGNTALYFANLAGPDGKVFSFDFTENVRIFKKNMALNPDLARRIVLIEKAVWKNSHDVLFFNENGPGTKVSGHPGEMIKPVLSISIDDLVDEEDLDRVDFIKMDIEGAERAAIAGATQTLRSYKPQLAITIYHNDMEDFILIPRMLKKMNLGYKFYLGHFTVYGEETVLFAKV